MANSPIIRNLGALAAGMTQLANRAQASLYGTPNSGSNGVGEIAWPDPLKPVSPIGPPNAQPLVINPLQMGQNLIYTPRPDAEYSALDLQKLSTYPLARLCIENVKDQICAMKWKIQAKLKPGENEKERDKRQQGDKTINALSAMLDRPNLDMEWPDFARWLLEDMLTIDAGSVLMRYNMTGTKQAVNVTIDGKTQKAISWTYKDNPKSKIIELRALPGDTITRYVDENGFTPQAPDVAYAQIWEGFPRVSLTTDQLIYAPRNIVRRGTLSSTMYGYSPTEQIAEEIKVGQERLNFVLSYYTKGSVPGMVQMVPSGTPPEKIIEAMQWQGSELAGNLAKRRQWRMMQSFSKEGKATDEIYEFKEPVLADSFDDLHIRKVCYSYGQSPQRLLKMIRTEGQSSNESAELEGLMPFLSWLRSLVNRIIQQKMGLTGYEIVWDMAREMDAEKQANAIKTAVGSAQITPNEGREMRGLPPDASPESDQLGIITATGWVPLSGSADRVQQAHEASIKQPKLVASGGKPTPEPELEPPTPKKKVTTKAAPLPTISPARVSPALNQARDGMAIRVELWLKRMARTAEGYRLPQVEKAEDHQKEIDEIVASILAQIDWESFVEVVESDLTAAALDGANYGLESLSVVDEEIVSVVQNMARDYAHDRAAELVGMKWVDGELVPNPNAEWRIDDTTRNMVRRTITEAFESETPIAEVIAKLEESPAFSHERAKLIAEQEVRQAQIRANLKSWLKVGVVEEFDWVLSGDHTCCDICDGFSAEGPYPLAEAQAMLDETHIGCLCILRAAKIKGID